LAFGKILVHQKTIFFSIVLNLNSSV
jgi:hypothetical protein